MFKVGDIVRIGLLTTSDFSFGGICTVITIEGRFIEVKSASSGRHGYIHENYLQLVSSASTPKNRFADAAAAVQKQILEKYGVTIDQLANIESSSIASNPEATHVHSWKTYQGFTECYDYCTKCDEKRK